MRNDTRKQYSAYCRNVALANGVEDARVMFNVAPPIAQRMTDVMREEVGFLNRVNVTPVSNLKGETLGLDVGGTIASVTKTTGTTDTREPIEITKIDKINEYETQQIDFDTAIAYRTLDTWRVYPDFQSRYARHQAKQIGRDIIMMAWNGEERAAGKSDRVLNPRLQDVAKGWLKKIEENAPERVHAGASITVGKTEEYKNIDTVAYDLIEEHMAEHHQDSTDLVCIIGRKLLHDKYSGLMNDNNTATELVNLDAVFATRHIAGMAAIVVPFFPVDAMLVTTLANLSIYTQEGSMRRFMKEVPERNRVEDYISQNMDFVVEDYTAVSYIKPGVISFV